MDAIFFIFFYICMKIQSPFNNKMENAKKNDFTIIFYLLIKRMTKSTNSTCRIWRKRLLPWSTGFSLSMILKGTCRSSWETIHCGCCKWRGVMDLCYSLDQWRIALHARELDNYITKKPLKCSEHLISYIIQRLLFNPLCHVIVTMVITNNFPVLDSIYI